MNIETIVKNAISYGLLEGYIYIALTDRLLFDKYDCNNKYEVDDNKMLECRIFNQKGEYRVIRTTLQSTFKERYIDDTNEFIEEKHFLDIDEKKLIKKEDETYDVVSTGGGKYHLPFNNPHDTKLVIHNYINYYEETGQACIYDYRLVRLEV